MKQSWFLVPLLLVAAVWGAGAQTVPPDLILQGTIAGSQNKTWLEVPFDVPAGIHRISVDFSYTGKENKTAIDLGIADAERFRGYSGGNKNHFTIGESDATPSYLPGPISAGKWKLLLSVPNIRATEISHYRAEIRFNSRLEDASFTLRPLETGTRWYRGDLHMHSAHSDGSCASQSGKRVPCPLFFSAQAAATHGLDFIAITDHNATSHYDAMRELQPYFDRLLLIPGREMTTFWGHFNIFGVTQYIDYRVVADGERNLAAILRDVHAAGGIASVNHADSPGGEVCMGCAWEPPSRIDMKQFTGVEVINGVRSSADFWDRGLATGAHLTAIGGSDSHNGRALAGERGAIGWPTTVVEAPELSVSAILDAIRLGRAFVDVTASHDKVVDLDGQDTVAGTGSAAHSSVVMGGDLMAAAGHRVAFRLHLVACADCRVRLFLDGRTSDALPALHAGSGDEWIPFQWTSDGQRHWIRAEVDTADGELALVSNPIYINDAGE